MDQLSSATSKGEMATEPDATAVDGDLPLAGPVCSHQHKTARSVRHRHAPAEDATACRSADLARWPRPAALAERDRNAGPRYSLSPSRGGRQLLLRCRACAR